MTLFSLKQQMNSHPLLTRGFSTKLDGPVFYGNTAQKMKFSIKDFFRKCDQIHSFLRIWSYLMKKSIMENFIFCAVTVKMLS